MTLNNSDDNSSSNNNSNTKYFSKPSIKFGNYFFVWSERGYGLCPSEINTLKSFVKKMIPFLEQYMNLLTFDHTTSSSQRKVNQNKSQICITEKYDPRISFMLFIDSSGSTVFYREEKFFIKTDRFGNLKNSNQEELVLYSKDFAPRVRAQEYNTVILKWLLGELLFNRIKSR